MEEALVTPTTVDPRHQTFTGCAYDQTGQLIRLSQRTKRRVAWTPSDPRHIVASVDAPRVGGQSIYLGHITDHYGHFLLESLSRFWALRGKSPFEAYVFNPLVHRAPDPTTFSPAKVCFECFGIPANRLLVVEELTRFERLLIPAALVEINRGANPAQARIYRQIANHCSALPFPIHESSGRLGVRQSRRKPRRRLYLSRSGLGSDYRRVVNENEVERLFESHGFATIYPEKLEFDEQVRLCREAELLAGLDGSALHNSVFMRGGGQVICLGDGRAADKPGRNQEICDHLAGVKSAFIPFCGQVLDPASLKVRVDIVHLQNRLLELMSSWYGNSSS